MYMGKKIFRTRISVLLSFLLVVVPLCCAILALPPLRWGVLGIVTGTLLLITFMFVSTRYIIDGSELKISGCMLGSRIAISNITSVKRSYSPLSAPASSLKRLEVKLRKNSFILVSPVREQEFIDALKAANPNIQINVHDKQGRWRLWDWDF
jgi:hypothetical protein